MKTIIFLLLILFCISCTKEANVKMPDTKSLPVVFCYLSPLDTIIKLKLTMSQPLYSEQKIDIYEPVKDASVFLSSAQGDIMLLYNYKTGYYEKETVNYPIHFGELYRISITLNNGNSAEATTKVPDNIVPISKASYQIYQENNFPYFRFKINFLDDPSTVNFYRISTVKLQLDSLQQDTIYTETSIKTIVKDNGHNGENLETTFNTFYGDTNNDGIVAHDVFLLNCNKEYYLFYNSLNNYKNENPFAEPSFIYTNIKGGLGVFAAYTLSKYRINI